MELVACIEGLKALEPANVVVHSDSQYVVNGVGWMVNWKRRNWRTKGKQAVKNRDLWEALDAQIARHASVRFKWVRGHSGSPLNERADYLAHGAARAAAILRGG